MTDSNAPRFAFHGYIGDCPGDEGHASGDALPLIRRFDTYTEARAYADGWMDAACLGISRCDGRVVVAGDAVPTFRKCDAWYGMDWSE